METTEQSEHLTSRRSFLLKGAAAGAATITAGRLLAEAPRAAASGGLTPGDAAILRFLAAAETLETDAWQQYNELGGIQDSEVPGGTGNAAYTAALSVLDSDMAQYVHDNTEDEFTHFDFINAYLMAHGRRPANLDLYSREPAHDLAADKLYERGWALALMEQVRTRLRAEYEAEGKAERFEIVEQFLPGEESGLSYVEAARQLGMAEGTLKSDVHRFEQRYRELLRAEIAHTVAEPKEVDEEL